MVYESPDTTSTAEWYGHHICYQGIPASTQPAGQPQAAIEQTPSMLVDMTLPRPIPAETALRMVRKVVQTLMYLRGQMSSTWEHLEFLLMQENMRQEMESQQENSRFYDPHLGTQNHEQDNDDEENDFIIPTKSLREVPLLHNSPILSPN
ncbi:hypothetical protein BGZ47_006336 [Haplosporangium gracile]|nr:hypothetical protein BGZ47_006336 [Haplosporangium gracile]